MFWDISIDQNQYKIKYFIKSYGITDQIFNYESLTLVKGYLDNDHLRPKSYKSKTKSTRQDVYTNILFNENGTINKFDISKDVSEDQIETQDRLLNKFLYFTDPVSQLTQYLLYNNNSDRLIIDGLNIYKLTKSEISSSVLKDNNPTIYNGQAKKLILTFPMFEGLHKIDKKNNLHEIHMTFKDLGDFFLPVQYDILSKKFNAKLYLKKYDITN